MPLRTRTLRSMDHRMRKGGSKKTDTRKCYLYMCDIGAGNYKIGVSCAPQRRVRQIRTYTPVARMASIVRIPDHKGKEWSRIESSVLRRFDAHRHSGGGREVFRLSKQKAMEATQVMREVCGR